MKPSNAPLSSTRLLVHVCGLTQYFHCSQSTEKVYALPSNSSSLLMMNGSRATRGHVSSRRFTLLATERKVSASPHNQALSALQFMYRKALGLADLGMEAIYEFDVVEMPVNVAVDTAGTSVHNTGLPEWQKRIATGILNAESI